MRLSPVRVKRDREREKEREREQKERGTEEQKGGRGKRKRSRHHVFPPKGGLAHSTPRQGRVVVSLCRFSFLSRCVPPQSPRLSSFFRFPLPLLPPSPFAPPLSSPLLLLPRCRSLPLPLLHSLLHLHSTHSHSFAVTDQVTLLHIMSDRKLPMDKSERILNELLKIPVNTICCDCGASSECRFLGQLQQTPHSPPFLFPPAEVVTVTSHIAPTWD